MRTLYLAYFYGTSAAVASRRLRMLVKKSAKANEQQYVLMRGTDDHLSSSPEVDIYTVSGQDLRSLLRSSGTEPAVISVKKEGWWRHLLPLRQAFPFLYLTDDGGPKYRSKAYRTGSNLIEKHGITTVFSSFRPWSDHLVARRLKKKYSYLHWIADFRDLPVDPVRKDVWFPALQRWWGKRVIRTAEELWVVSEGQRAQLAGWHPNIKVVRNALLSLPPEASAPATERFTIAYTGSLYPGLQSVAPLVFALKNLLSAGALDTDKICIIYRGKDDGIFQKWTSGLPDECLDIQPSIAPAAAQKIQREAQVLLLLNWSAPGYYGVLTAKLWDYLAAGRPVLALVNGPGDEELKSIIEGAAAGAVFANEEQERLEDWIGEKYASWLANGELPWSPDLQKLTRHL